MSHRRRAPHRTRTVEEVGPTSLVARARRMRDRGEARKAIGLLRDACLHDEADAALWTQYGAMLAEAGRVDDAERALKHALWLRRSAGDAQRMRSTQALIDRLAVPSAA